MHDDRTPSVLLVHGAWHGAWCWDRVVAGLSSRGVPVVTVDLPSHGDDPGPMGDLHTDADAVRRALDTLGAPVVLVGHSYGGAVITEAGDHTAVRELVYICAMALDEGETCMVAGTELPGVGEISHGGRPDIASGTIVSDDGLVSLEPALANAALFHHCDARTAAWALARLRPQALVTLEQSPATVAWRTRPCTYVVCSDDQIVHPGLQRLMAKRCAGTILEWDSDHSPFLSHPDLVVDLLAGIAR